MTTGINGRRVRIRYDADGAGAGAAVEIARATTDNLSVNNEMLDITAKDDSGKRLLMNDTALQTVSMTCSGVAAALAQHRTLVELTMNAGAGTSLHWFELFAEGLGTFRGQFYIESFELGAEASSAATFSMSLQSSGPNSFVKAV